LDISETFAQALEPSSILAERLADGVYLKAKGRTDLLTKILETAGL
jgi:hypothetical protein